MGKAQREWARRARVKLIERLGGKCAKCPANEGLTLDCIQPMGDEHHRLDMVRRTSFYRIQHLQDNIQLLCAECHKRKNINDATKARRLRKKQEQQPDITKNEPDPF